LKRTADSAVFAQERSCTSDRIAVSQRPGARSNVGPLPSAGTVRVPPDLLRQISRRAGQIGLRAAGAL